MGRHQAPEAVSADPDHASPPVPSPAGRPAADDPPTERLDPVGTSPAYRRPADPPSRPAGPHPGRPVPPVGATRVSVPPPPTAEPAHVAPPTADATRARPAPFLPPAGGVRAEPAATRAEPPPFLPPGSGATRAEPPPFLPPGGGATRAEPPPFLPPGRGATRAGAAGWGSRTEAPARLDDSTGTFTRVLLAGLGGSAEPVAEPAYAPPPGPPPPAPRRAWARAVATTRRLAARVAALRGDERTALLAIGAAVGLVLLLVVVLVAVARLTGGSGPAPAAAAATPAATSAAAATPSPTPEPTPTGPPLPPSGGAFAARHSGLCLSAPPNRTDAGAQLVQRACGTDFGGTFLLVAKDQPDTYELVDVGTSLCVDVYGGSQDNGAPVLQWDCTGNPNQTFTLRPLADPTGAATGYVQIVAAHSGKCLDVVGMGTGDGTPIQQYDCRDAATEAAAGNQSWRFSAT